MTRLVRQLKNELTDRGYYNVHPESVKSGFISAAFLVGFGSIYFFGFMMNLGGDFLSVLLSIAVTIGLIVFFSGKFSSRTPVGAVKHREAEAFYEAMHRREHYMDWFSKTNLDMAKYEQYLPYAVAFGLTSEWAEICGDAIEGLPSFCESPYHYDSGLGYLYWHTGLVHTFSDINHEVDTPLQSALNPSKFRWQRIKLERRLRIRRRWLLRRRIRRRRRRLVVTIPLP